VAKLDRDIIIGKVGCLFTRRLSSGDKAQEGNSVTVSTIQTMLLICKKEKIFVFAIRLLAVIMWSDCRR